MHKCIRNLLQLDNIICNNIQAVISSKLISRCMTSARSLKIDLTSTPYYHCMTRCVRRTYLCGSDTQTGQDYNHRKEWIVCRLKKLADIFAIHICAYAIMSNHYHLVLYVNTKQANNWNDNEVVERWSALFTNDAKQVKQLELTPQQIVEKIALWRERLVSISWFMRCLNEFIARISNEEDNLTGRFWEARFKSQALLDEGAVLAAMAYVDLNPIRAKVAKTPEESEYTSIYERIHAAAKALNKAQLQTINPTKQELKIDNAKQPQQLMAFANGKPNDNDEYPKIEFSFSDYLQLVDSTGRILRDDKRGAIPESLAPILTRLNLSSNGWLNMVRNLEKDFSYAIGNQSILVEFGARFRKRPPKGIKAAKKYYKVA